MATASRIEEACRPDRAPSISPFFSEVGESVLHMTAAPVEVEERIRRKVITKLFTMFGALHGCTFKPAEGDEPARKCTREGHKRDMAACREALEFLGIIGNDLVLDDAWDDPDPTPAPTRKATRPDWNWANRAACRGESLVLFFGADGERQPERDFRERKAKAICAGCPVRVQCKDFAIGRPEKYGTWGQLNEDERASERRRRMRRAADRARVEQVDADAGDENLASEEAC